MQPFRPRKHCEWEEVFIIVFNLGQIEFLTSDNVLAVFLLCSRPQMPRLPHFNHVCYAGINPFVRITNLVSCSDLLNFAGEQRFQLKLIHSMKAMPLSWFTPNCLNFINQDLVRWDNFDRNSAVFLEDVDNAVMMNSGHLKRMNTKVVDLQFLKQTINELVQLLSLTHILIRSARSQEVRLRFVLCSKAADNRIHHRLDQIERDPVNVNVSVVLTKPNLIRAVG